MDQQVFLSIFTYVQSSPVLTYVANAFAIYGIWILYVIIIAGLVVPEKYSLINKKVALITLLAFVIALIVKKLFVNIFPTPRPTVLFGIHPSIDQETYEFYRSFPSGHAVSSFAIATAIFLYNKKLGAILLVLAFCIALARIAVGVHFPEDVLVGAVVGMCIGIGTYTFVSRNR